MPQAALIGCFHTCPAYDGDHPHTGGKVVQGSPDVYASSRGICRVGDMLQCDSSSPDTIVGGSLTVFINGVPAARFGDPCAHGGIVVEGAPDVFIHS